jgi:hypothetical protein
VSPGQDDSKPLVGSTTNENVIHVSVFGDSGLDVDAEHYEYEITMLAFTFDHYRPESDEGSSEQLLNALLESYLVHARALTSFYYPTSERKDDVSAKQFTGKKMDDTNAVALRLIDVREDLNKRLAHMTRRRRIKPDGYNLGLIFGDILESHRRFVEMMDVAHPGQDIFPTVRELAEEFDERWGESYRRMASAPPT